MPPSDIEKVRMYWDYQKTLLNTILAWTLGAYLTLAILLYQYAQSSLWWVVPFFAIAFFVLLLPTLGRLIIRRFRRLSREVDELLAKVAANAPLGSLEELVEKGTVSTLGSRFPSMWVGLPAVAVLVAAAILVILYFLSTLNLGIPGFDLGIFGLSLSLAGAVILIIPRLRTLRKIESQASLELSHSYIHWVKAFREDTRLAIVGLSFLIVGFLLQLLGRVLP